MLFHSSENPTIERFVPHVQDRRSVARGYRRMALRDEGTRLLEAQVLNVLVGNAACHGKNSSVLHLPDGTIRLAPCTT